MASPQDAAWRDDGVPAQLFAPKRKAAADPAAFPVAEAPTVSPALEATPPAPHARLADESLWGQLGAETQWPAFAAAFLALQANAIPRTLRAAVVLATPQGAALDTVWPASDTAHRLKRAGEAALSGGKGVLQRGASETATPSVIAYPVMRAGAPVAAVALEVATQDAEALRGAMRQLRWGAAWLRERLSAGTVTDAADRAASAHAALESLAAAADADGFGAACRAAATDLARRFSCERVTVGLRRRGKTKVRAVSHSASFGKQMNLTRMTAAAMDEAIDQRSVIVHPVAAGDLAVATRAHAAHARAHGAGHILTIPMFVADRYVGAFTFERAADEPFDQATVDTLEASVAVLSPMLEEKRRADRWALAVLASAASSQIARLLGPGHYARKLTLLAVVALVGFFAVATTTYRVTADAVIEGSVQRAIVASFDGYLQEAPVRAGDVVAAGDVLATLDDQDLALERLRWLTERQRNEYEYDRAVAQRDRAEARIAQTQVEQAEAQIRLIDEQLERARLRAPFDGLVVAGDLSQQIGGAVTRGDVLFQVAPLDQYRVVLQVDERRVADVVVGQEGRLIVASLPADAFPIAIEKITPVAQYADGRTTFKVEARLVEGSARLRPGMEGVAKIEVGEEKLITTWARPVIDWFRLFIWRWVP